VLESGWSGPDGDSSSHSKNFSAMLLATIPSFHGYYEVDALEVGKTGTLQHFGHNVFSTILTQLGS
jgi:hypothetical protein